MIKLGKKLKNFSFFVFICELFFIGRLKFAPGTVASILTVLMGYYLLKNLNLIEFIMVIIIVNFIGYISIELYLKRVHEKGHADWYLTPKECKKINLANYLRVPVLNIRVKVEMELE